MSHAFTLVERFQDLLDGPGELGARDDGKVPVWSQEDGRLIMLPLPQPAEQRIVVRGGGGGGSGVSRLQDASDFAGTLGAGTDGQAIIWDNAAGAFTLGAFEIAGSTDFTDTTGSGTDGYAITWDNGTGKFILSASGGGTPGGSTTQVQYNSGGSFAGDAGLTYDAANDALTVAGRVVTPVIRPASDSATAVRVQNAAGTTDVLAVDTTSGYVGVGITPVTHLDVYGRMRIEHKIGARNIFINSGNDTLTGTDNIGLSSYNSGTLSSLTTGTNNIAIGGRFGQGTGKSITTGSDNCLLGNGTGNLITTGIGNTFMGALAGWLIATGSYNTCVGRSGGYPTTGNRNVVIGATTSLYGPTSGSDNILIGFDTNVPVPTASFQLCIGNFIYGTGLSGKGSTVSVGNIGLGEVAPTAILDLTASTSARASLRIRSGTAPTAPNDGDVWNNGNALALRVNGTNAVNTDGGLSVWMQATTNAYSVGRLLWQYTDKTDATRATRGSLTAYYTTTEHKPITWGANSGGALLSFYDVTTPIARQVLATGAGATVDDVITVLQALGLVKQS